MSDNQTTDATVTPTGRFSGANSKLILVIGTILILFACITGLWIMKFRANAQAAASAKVANIGNEGDGTPGITPDPRTRELLERETMEKTQAAMAEDSGAYVTPIMASNSAQPVTQAPVPAAVVKPVQTQQQSAPKRRATVEDYFSLRRTIDEYTASRGFASHTVAVANAPIPVAAAASSVATPLTAAAVGLMPGDTLLARLEIGINSDYPNAVVVSVISPAKYKGYILNGRFNVKTRYATQPVVEFTQAFSPGIPTPIQIMAVAVDPQTRIPALQGSTNYHITRNLVYGLGGTFAQAYAQTAASRFSAFSNTTSFDSGLNPGRDGAAAALGAVAFDTNIRPPTITISAGTLIAAVIVSSDQPRQTPTQPQPFPELPPLPNATALITDPTAPATP